MKKEWEDFISEMKEKGWKGAKPNTIIEVPEGTKEIDLIFLPSEDTKASLEVGSKSRLYLFDSVYLFKGKEINYLMTFVTPVLRVRLDKPKSAITLIRFRRETD